MGKRRRAAGKAQNSSEDGFVPAAEPRVRLNVQSWEDVADSEDEFFLNQDKVLLEEAPARKKLRKLEEEADFLQPSDEEVLPLPDSDPDRSDEDEPSDPRDDGSKKKGAPEGRPGPDEVTEEDELAGWGDSKRDYYDADAIETAADALEEEKEALRLQKKQLQGMQDADYGFDEADWLEGTADADETGDKSNTVQEVIPSLASLEFMTEEEKLKILSIRYPELEPLSQEFLALQDVFDDLNDSVSTTLQTASEIRNTDQLPSALLKRNVLASYLGSLAMYLSILSSGSRKLDGNGQAKPPTEMREHPIMEALVATRSTWEKVRDLTMPEPRHFASDQDEGLSSQLLPVAAVSTEDQIIKQEKTARSKKSKKSKAKREAETALEEAAARRLQHMQRVEAELATLGASAPISTSSKALQLHPPSKSPSIIDSDSDFGEAEALTAEEAEDKARRKRGLRFYTSKITAKSLKRDRATRDGGDMDIPYRERLRDRQARLDAAAEKRGASIPDDLSADGDSDEDDRPNYKKSGISEAQLDDDEDYYDLVAGRTQRKKDTKVAEAAARRQGQSNGAGVDDAEADLDGKREITYAIAKNKGLTPKRKKEGRNPRVKKRNRFEAKTKKLNSVRAVYKGEERGGYGGEKTGIRKNLVKSVKL